MKRCPRCQETKQVTDFNKDSRTTDKLATYCRVCNRARVRAWQLANPERVREHTRKRAERGAFREYKIRTKYGLLAADYDALLAAQGGVCAICGGTEGDKRRKNLAVDHCHASNRVRGLLCNNCNRALGLLQDDPELLKKAEDYLRSAEVNARS